MAGSYPALGPVSLERLYCRRGEAVRDVVIDGRSAEAVTI
jgi:hypothetical protein